MNRRRFVVGTVALAAGAVVPLPAATAPNWFDGAWCWPVFRELIDSGAYEAMGFLHPKGLADYDWLLHADFSAFDREQVQAMARCMERDLQCVRRFI